MDPHQKTDFVMVMLRNAPESYFASDQPIAYCRTCRRAHFNPGALNMCALRSHQIVEAERPSPCVCL